MCHSLVSIQTSNVLVILAAGSVHTCCTTFPFIPGSLMNFGQTFKASSWVHFDVYWLHFGLFCAALLLHFCSGFGYVGILLSFIVEALVLAYGLNASTCICFLWFEDTSHDYASLLACFCFFLSRLGIEGHHFYLWNFGLVASWYLWCEVCSTNDLLPL
jgi:hypothetical protein